MWGDGGGGRNSCFNMMAGRWKRDPNDLLAHQQPMKKAESPKDASLPMLSVLPFPLAILTTLAFVLTVGTHFPRDIAPGSSLILPGLLLSIAVLLVVMGRVRRRWSDPAPRRFSLILCVITSALAWPVWTTGILPSVNGIKLGAEQISTMRLAGLTTSHASKGRQIYYWARLQATSPASRIGSGRYFVPKAIHDGWQSRTGQEVAVVHATGLLGAETVLSFR